MIRVSTLHPGRVSSTCAMFRATSCLNTSARTTILPRSSCLVSWIPSIGAVPLFRDLVFQYGLDFKDFGVNNSFQTSIRSQLEVSMARVLKGGLIVGFGLLLAVA